MIVLDASAVVLALLNDDHARSILGHETIVCPHLVDSEVLHALRSLVSRGEIDAAMAGRAIEAWGALGIARMTVHGLLSRIWELRENLSAYDATYVALAEGLDVTLVTADGRLGRAQGPRCAITIVRR